MTLTFHLTENIQRAFHEYTVRSIKFFLQLPEQVLSFGCFQNLPIISNTSVKYLCTTTFGRYVFFQGRFISLSYFYQFIGKKRILHFNLHFHNSFRLMVFIFFFDLQGCYQCQYQISCFKMNLCRVTCQPKLKEPLFAFIPVNTWRPKPKPLLRWENKLLQLLHTFLSLVVLLLCNNKNYLVILAHFEIELVKVLMLLL